MMSQILCGKRAKWHYCYGTGFCKVKCSKHRLKKPASPSAYYDETSELLATEMCDAKLKSR